MLNLTIEEAAAALLFFMGAASAFILVVAAIGDLIRNWRRPEPLAPEPILVSVPVTPAEPDPDEIHLEVFDPATSMREMLAAYGTCQAATRHEIGAAG